MLFSKLPHPHLISLEWKRERRSRFFNNALNRGLANIQWFPAIDGIKMPDLPAWARSNPGVYGCLHSHVSLYKLALFKGWDALTVFEDDAKIKQSEARIVAALNAQASSADIFMLYPPLSKCLGAWAYVIRPPLMREIVRRLEQDPFPEGHLAHIDQLIHSLSLSGWKKVNASDILVDHGPRDPTESTIKWSHCYRPPSDNLKSNIETSTPLAITAKPRILIGICSCAKNHERRKAIRETWLENLPYEISAFFFMADSQSGKGEADEIILTGTSDTYERLPEKVILFFRHALQYFEFDWLFKCDDDTYVATERLFKLIKNGAALVGNEFLKAQGFASGGAGYLISHNWVNRIAGCKIIPSEGPEDVLITKYIISKGGRTIPDARLRWNSKLYPRRDNGIITSHWCEPDKMRAIHTIFRRIPSRIIDVSHSNWADRLHLFDNGSFARISTYCMGTWCESDKGSIVLRWFDWEQETLTPFRSVVENGNTPRYLCYKHPLDKIIVELAGGLGNQMFQFACGLMIARTLGVEISLNCKDNIRGFKLGRFGLKLDTLDHKPDYVFSNNRSYIEGDEWTLLNSIMQSRAKIVKISGYFQNQAYFAGVAEEVHSIFYPSNHTHRRCTTNEVIIHVRRGDFVGNLKHDACGISYFLLAIKLMSSMIEDAIFTVISDDPEWCLEAFKEDPRINVSDLRDDGESFNYLCCGTAFILSNSTFGWWGAWLARGNPVIAPNRFLTDAVWNICPDGWITIPSNGLD